MDAAPARVSSLEQPTTAVATAVASESVRVPAATASARAPAAAAAATPRGDVPRSESVDEPIVIVDETIYGTEESWTVTSWFTTGDEKEQRRRRLIAGGGVLLVFSGLGLGVGLGLGLGSR